MTTMTTLHAATSHGCIPRTHCVIATKQVGLLTSPRLNVHRAGDALDNGQNWQIPCWMTSLDLYLASLLSVSISHTHKPAINNIHIQTRNNPSMSGKSQMTKSDASRVQSGQVSSAERETGHDSCSCRCRQAAVKIWDLEVRCSSPSCGRPQRKCRRWSRQQVGRRQQEVHHMMRNTLEPCSAESRSPSQCS